MRDLFSIFWVISMSTFIIVYHLFRLKKILLSFPSQNIFPPSQSDLAKTHIFEKVFVVFKVLLIKQVSRLLWSSDIFTVVF